MDRTIFGSWGSDLTDAEFAKALAALGIQNAQPHYLPTSSKPADIAEALSARLGEPDQPIRCHYFIGPNGRLGASRPVPPARALAEAWDRLRLRIGRDSKYRVAFQNARPSETGRHFEAEIFEQLRNPALNVKSIYVGEQSSILKIDWRWPIRIGLLTVLSGKGLRGVLRLFYVQEFGTARYDCYAKRSGRPPLVSRKCVIGSLGIRKRSLPSSCPRRRSHWWFG